MQTISYNNVNYIIIMEDNSNKNNDQKCSLCIISIINIFYSKLLIFTKPITYILENYFLVLTA